VARTWFLLRIDLASEKIGITSFSAVVQWVSCRTRMKASLLVNNRYLLCSKTLGVQLEYIGSWVMLGSISAAAPFSGRGKEPPHAKHIQCRQQ